MNISIDYRREWIISWLENDRRVVATFSNHELAEEYIILKFGKRQLKTISSKFDYFKQQIVAGKI